MSATQTPALDMDKLNQFVGQFVTDLGAAVHAGHGCDWRKAGTVQGAGGGSPMTSAELAAKTEH